MIDNAWKEHLREMDELKQSVQNAAYEQKDPLLIYKFESFELFKTMVQRTNKEIISFLLKCDVPIQAENVRGSPGPEKAGSRANTRKAGTTCCRRPMPTPRRRSRPQPVKVEKKVGRNDPCPCGSGKKYKNCHGVGE